VQKNCLFWFGDVVGVGDFLDRRIERIVLSLEALVLVKLLKGRMASSCDSQKAAVHQRRIQGFEDDQNSKEVMLGAGSGLI